MRRAPTLPKGVQSIQNRIFKSGLGWTETGERSSAGGLDIDLLILRGTGVKADGS